MPVDPALLGRARYAGDLTAPGMAHLAFERSPEAHARIRAIDTSAAEAMPGVLAVWRAADLALVPIWEIHLIPEDLAQPPLAIDVVRHVGDRVVAIVADSPAAAADAAELVHVDYEPLPAVLHPRDAPGGPPLHDRHPDNVALSWSSAAGDLAEQSDDVTVSGTVVMPRVAVAPLEGLAVLAVPGTHGRLTMYASTQTPTGTQIQTARSLGVDPEAVRVIAPAVGGAFGGKSLGGIAEYVVAAAAARRLGRPVRYVQDRGENLAGMHGRGMELTYRVRADRRGALRAVEVDELADAGAYPQTNAVEPGKTQLMLCGPYRVPAARFQARTVMTNRAPSGAYRGPGRAEAAAVLESAMDRLAAALDLDPIEVRRVNLLRADELPARTVTGADYDDSDHHRQLDELLARSGYEQWRADQAARVARGDPRRLGIGVATIVDSSAWFARTEPIRVAVGAEGTVSVIEATASARPRPAEAYARIVANALAVGRDAIVVTEGDTDALTGTGSSGSRSLQLAGSALARASGELAATLRSRAADLLEAAVDDVVVAEGRYIVRGSPSRGVTLAQVAAATHRADGADALATSCVFEQGAATHPTAAHLSVVEVDLDTGAVAPLRHVAVTDCGTVVDPARAEGQVVGAIAQGIAQALGEAIVYDDTGTPRNASLAEYAMPAASELSPIEAHFLERDRTGAAPINPLGAKGVGEIGMVAAPAAVRGAVLDALGPLGVDTLELPCTPEAIWRALAAAPASRPSAG